MIGDACEHLAQVGFGIEPVQLGRLDQGVEGGRAFGPKVGTGEQVILAPDRDAAQRPLGCGPALVRLGAAPSAAGKARSWHRQTHVLKRPTKTRKPIKSRL